MIDKRRHIQTDDPRFVKDIRSSALLNIDTASYNTYKQERSRILRQQEIEQQVIDLKQDVSDLKQLLQQLLNGRTNGKSNI